jgi:elongation factor Ts
MTVTMDQIKQLRTATGVGIGDCKAALTESNGDFEKAKLILREKGKKLAAKVVTATEGVIGHYVHHNQQVAVLVELSCQTDFVARNKKGPFQEFARDVAMHVASSNPAYVSRDEVPSEDVERERAFLIEQAKASGRPEKIIETKIIPGQMERFFAAQCLLDQPFVKDEKIKVKDRLADLAAQIGEVIAIKRFIRYKVG